MSSRHGLVGPGYNQRNPSNTQHSSYEMTSVVKEPDKPQMAELDKLEMFLGVFVPVGRKPPVSERLKRIFQAVRQGYTERDAATDTYREYSSEATRQCESVQGDRQRSDEALNAIRISVIEAARAVNINKQENETHVALLNRMKDDNARARGQLVKVGKLLQIGNCEELELGVLSARLAKKVAVLVGERGGAPALPSESQTRPDVESSWVDLGTGEVMEVTRRNIEAQVKLEGKQELQQARDVIEDLRRKVEVRTVHESELKAEYASLNGSLERLKAKTISFTKLMASKRVESYEDSAEAAAGDLGEVRDLLQGIGAKFGLETEGVSLLDLTEWIKKEWVTLCNSTYSLAKECFGFDCKSETPVKVVNRMKEASEQQKRVRDTQQKEWQNALKEAKELNEQLSLVAANLGVADPAKEQKRKPKWSIQAARKAVAAAVGMASKEQPPLALVDKLTDDTKTLRTELQTVATSLGVDDAVKEQNALTLVTRIKEATTQLGVHISTTALLLRIAGCSEVRNLFTVATELKTVAHDVIEDFLSVCELFGLPARIKGRKLTDLSSRLNNDARPVVENWWKVGRALQLVSIGHQVYLPDFASSCADNVAQLVRDRNTVQQDRDILLAREDQTNQQAAKAKNSAEQERKRYNELLALRIRQDTSSFQDLNDPVRPEVVVRKFQDVCNVERLDAADELEEDHGVEGVECLVVTCDVMMASWKTAKEMLKNVDVDMAECLGKKLLGAGLKMEVQHELKGAERTSFYSRIQKAVTEQFREKHEGFAKEGGEIKGFLAKCAEVAWMVVLTSPSMSLVTNTGEKFDSKHHVLFSECRKADDATVTACLWPALKFDANEGFEVKPSVFTETAETKKPERKGKGDPKNGGPVDAGKTDANKKFVGGDGEERKDEKKEHESPQAGGEGAGDKTDASNKSVCGVAPERPETGGGPARKGSPQAGEDPRPPPRKTGKKEKENRGNGGEDRDGKTDENVMSVDEDQQEGPESLTGTEGVATSKGSQQTGQGPQPPPSPIAPDVSAPPERESPDIKLEQHQSPAMQEGQGAACRTPSVTTPPGFAVSPPVSSSLDNNKEAALDAERKKNQTTTTGPGSSPLTTDRAGLPGTKQRDLHVRQAADATNLVDPSGGTGASGNNGEDHKAGLVPGQVATGGKEMSSFVDTDLSEMLESFTLTDMEIVNFQNPKRQPGKESGVSASHTTSALDSQGEHQQHESSPSHVTPMDVDDGGADSGHQQHGQPQASQPAAGAETARPPPNQQQLDPVIKKYEELKGNSAGRLARLLVTNGHASKPSEAQHLLCKVMEEAFVTAKSHVYPGTAAARGIIETGIVRSLHLEQCYRNMPSMAYFVQSCVEAALTLVELSPDLRLDTTTDGGALDMTYCTHEDGVARDPVYTCKWPALLLDTTVLVKGVSLLESWV